MARSQKRRDTEPDRSGLPCISDEEIEDLVTRILHRLPEDIRKAVDNAVIHIEDKPSRELLRDHPGISPSILGLYVGVPVSRQSFFSGFIFPPQIFLFRKNIARCVRNRGELRRQLEETLLHEIGHHLGLSEAALRRLERDLRR